MNTRIILLIPFLLATGALLWAPWLAPKYTFFGVRLPRTLRDDGPGRQAWRDYCLAIVLTALIGAIWILLWPTTFWTALLPPLLLIAVGIGVFFWNNHKLRPLRLAPPTVAAVELSADPDRFPRFFWWSVLPFAVLTVTAFYLHFHWAEIPARFPVHWGANGQPNGWSSRSFLGVYGGLIFGGMLMIPMIALAIAVWYRARRSPMRVAFGKTMIGVAALLGLVFSWTALIPIFHFSPSVTALAIVGGVIAIVAFSLVTLTRAASQTRDDRTPEERWSGGFFYNNPEDPSWFVPRRDGLGYTPNLAHWESYALLFALIVIALLGPKLIS